jgi:ADP-L-glycero-D-manno-heptose 6-epimerase
VVSWLFRTPDVNGLFNLGSGEARTFADLASAMSAAAGRRPEIDFIDMPPELRGQYQYYTRAPMDRLRAAGFTAPPTRLEDGLADYVKFLTSADPHR